MYQETIWHTSNGLIRIMENRHCSNCGFLWNEHPNGAKDNETYTIVRFMLENDKAHPDCECKRFKPMDNLEYLEWKEKHGR